MAAAATPDRGPSTARATGDRPSIDRRSTVHRRPSGGCATAALRSRDGRVTPDLRAKSAEIACESRARTLFSLAFLDVALASPYYVVVAMCTTRRTVHTRALRRPLPRFVALCIERLLRPPVTCAPCASSTPQPASRGAVRAPGARRACAARTSYGARDVQRRGGEPPRQTVE
jgi:hypothetical protein